MTKPYVKPEVEIVEFIIDETITTIDDLSGELGNGDAM